MELEELTLLETKYHLQNILKMLKLKVKGKNYRTFVIF